MGAYDRLPDPLQELRRAAPRTGPAVPNMGGMPAQPNAPQRTNLVSQPAVQTGPPGPAAAPQPVGMPPPPPGVAPAPVAPWTPLPPPPPAAAPAPAPAAAPAQPAAPPAPPEPLEEELSVGQSVAYTPTPEQLRMLGPGQGVRTEFGDIYKHPVTGALTMRLNDAGKAAHQAAHAQALRRFGTYPWSTDPAAPAPPIEIGKPAFNPFARKGEEWS